MKFCDYDEFFRQINEMVRNLGFDVSDFTQSPTGLTINLKSETGEITVLVLFFSKENYERSMMDEPKKEVSA